MARKTFPDLSPNAYYTQSVSRLNHAGVMMGYPDAPITRLEAIVLLARAFKISPETNTPLSYADNNKIFLFAKEAVQTFTSKVYLFGNPNNMQEKYTSEIDDTIN